MLTKQLMPFGIFIIILAFLWQGLHLKPTELSSVLLGKPVPSFALPSLKQDAPLITPAIFKGQITLVNVWASWCASCAQEHLFLKNLDKTDEFQLVGINYKDSKNNADLWLNNRGDPYKVIIFDAEGSLSIDLGVYGTPTTYIIDRDGIIRYRHVGVLTNDIWNAAIIPEISKLKK